MDDFISNLINECRRQEESCLYTSASFYEWLKCMRWWRVLFVVGPIILGGVATWPLLTQEPGYEWVTGICALLAGLMPAVYKALDFDVSLNEIAKHAHQYKILQDRFRQAWSITALEEPDKLRGEFDELMKQMDATRSSSLTAPERFFISGRKKIISGHYTFTVDENDQR